MIEFFKDEYAFLSNFYPSPIGVQFGDGTSMIAPTAEHFFQCLKTPSREEEIAILAAPTLDEAKDLADSAIAAIDLNVEEFLAGKKEEEDEAMRELLDDVQYNIMKIAISKELGA